MGQIDQLGVFEAFNALFFTVHVHQPDISVQYSTVHPHNDDII